MSAEQRGEFAHLPEFAQEGKKEKGAVDITAEFEQLREMMPQLGKKMTEQERTACERFAGKIVDSLIKDMQREISFMASFSGDQQVFRGEAVSALTEALPDLINLKQTTQEISVESYMRQKLVDIILQKQRALLAEGTKPVRTKVESNKTDREKTEEKLWAERIVNEIISEEKDYKVQKFLEDKKDSAIELILQQQNNSLGVAVRDRKEMKEMVRAYARRLVEKKAHSDRSKTSRLAA